MTLLTGLAAVTLAAAKPGFTQAAPACAADCEDPIIDGKRVALVIGNAGYGANGWTRISTAVNDAEAVAKALEKANFDVVLVEDGSKSDLDNAAKAFRTKAATADVAVVYFSGHGFELANANYIVPIGALGDVSVAQLQTNYMPFGAFVEAGRQAKFSLFLLDACREDGPVQAINAGATQFRSIDAPHSAIMFATASGLKAHSEAPPGSKLSPFAAAVTRGIETQGIELSSFLRSSVRQVSDATKGMNPQQWPQIAFSTYYRFYFLAPEPPVSPTKPAPGTPAAPSISIPMQRLATVDEPVLVAEILAKHKATEVLAAAEAGDPLAQYLVGYFFAFGDGFAKDDTQARSWLERAAASGHPAGQLELAYFLTRRSPDAATKTRALELYQKAAAQNYPKAQTHLAVELMRGTLGVADKPTAKSLLEEAAKADYSNAIYQLALLGDEAASRARLTTLAAAGDTSASHWLCQLDVARKQWSTAAPACLTAARSGFADSRSALAKMYAVGTGVPRSATEARYWALFAITQPDLAPGNRSELRSLLHQMGFDPGENPERARER